MNPKYQLLRKAPYIILVLVIIGLISSFYIKEEVPLKLLSKSTVYSHYYTNELETIHIHLLSNKKDDYHFLKEQVISSKLYTEEENISVNIKEIKVESTPIIHNETEFYPLTVSIRLPLIADNFLVHLNGMSLSMTYENQDQIDIYLGELYYLFNSQNNADLSLENLSATYEEYQSNKTVGGVLVDLKNNTNENLYITEINMLSDNITLNNTYMEEDVDCDYLDTVVNCLHIDDYSFTDNNNQYHSTLFRSNNSISLYIPLSYTLEYQFIDRFGIEVVYMKDGAQKTWYIDDFPFIRTSFFQTLEEGEYHESVVQLSNQ